MEADSEKCNGSDTSNIEQSPTIVEGNESTINTGASALALSEVPLAPNSSCKADATMKRRQPPSPAKTPVKLHGPLPSLFKSCFKF